MSREVPLSDAFVPEADRLDQIREISSPPVAHDDAPSSALPEERAPSARVPVEASEGDVLEQMQEVGADDDGYD